MRQGKSGYARDREQGNTGEIWSSDNFLNGLVCVEIDGGSG